MSDTDFWITPDGLDHQAGGFDAYAEMATSAKQWVESTAQEVLKAVEDGELE